MAQENGQLNFYNHLLEMMRLGFLDRKTYKKLMYQSSDGLYEDISISQAQFKIVPTFFNFNKTIFRGVTFKKCVFENIRFLESELLRVNFIGCIFNHCDFSSAKFEECFFDKSYFEI